MNYYQILGLEPDCTSKQIRTQYRKLALKCHPDRHKGNHLYVEQFFEIQQAYEVLINHQSRAEYDLQNNIYIQETDNSKHLSTPYIISFRCDLKSFSIGEDISFHWKVSGADYIAIQPFGRVFNQEGSKTIKINTHIDVLRVKIIAKNSKTGEYTTENIHLQGKRIHKPMSAEISKNDPIRNNKIDSENEKDEREKTTLWGYVLLFIIITLAVIFLLGGLLTIVSDITGNEFYKSNEFFLKALPYISVISIAIFVYSVSNSD